ncbi:MAG: hypothetical protein WCI71_13290 [Bacteroidota bacterium]
MKYILTLFLFGLILVSCNKEDSEDKTKYLYLSEDIKPYKCKTGSYWVFQNDTTGTLDSITVISTENDFYWLPPPIHGQSGVKHEYYKINLISHASSQTYNDYLTFHYIKRNGGGEYGEKGQPVFMTESDIGTEFNGMRIIAKFPSLTFNNITFNNVVETKITASRQYQIVYFYDTYLYFSDSVGLIRKITDLGNGNLESWSIKRWTVIR